ncbi:MAG: peptidoglycan recognition protein family protein [Cyanobacteria bacterium]|nr:peptidoglycan recognition protein family protein [Cyanobacteriota bacterium]MDW8201605.1 peptidoglycan recognition family protein [Cyanobacteriota bacterium SKYGB_h_bin112]
MLSPRILNSVGLLRTKQRWLVGAVAAAALALTILLLWFPASMAQTSQPDISPEQLVAQATQTTIVRPLMTAPCASDIPEQLVASFSQPYNNLPAYQPRQIVTFAHQTNFGDRKAVDVKGKAVYNEPLVVLHETVGSLYGAISLFQTPHPRDDDQVSYHTLIGLDGTIVYIVSPDKRAYGAGNSSFQGEAVQTNPRYPASVNNFAYHISLETPPSGIHSGRRHQGYTDAQYRSLAWLVARTGVPNERLTTHREVDRSNSRLDPRSFDWRKFKRLLDAYPREDLLGLSCSMPNAQNPADLYPPSLDTTVPLPPLNPDQLNLSPR